MRQSVRTRKKCGSQAWRHPVFAVFDKHSFPDHRRRRWSKGSRERTLQHVRLERKVVALCTFAQSAAVLKHAWSTAANWQRAVTPSHERIWMWRSDNAQLAGAVGMPVAETGLAGEFFIADVAAAYTGSAGAGIDNHTGANTFSSPISSMQTGLSST